MWDSLRAHNGCMVLFRTREDDAVRRYGFVTSNRAVRRAVGRLRSRRRTTAQTQQPRPVASTAPVSSSAPRPRLAVEDDMSAVDDLAWMAPASQRTSRTAILSQCDQAPLLNVQLAQLQQHVPDIHSLEDFPTLTAAAAAGTKPRSFLVSLDAAPDAAAAAAATTSGGATDTDTDTSTRSEFDGMVVLTLADLKAAVGDDDASMSEFVDLLASDAGTDFEVVSQLSDEASWEAVSVPGSVDEQGADSPHESTPTGTAAAAAGGDGGAGGGGYMAALMAAPAAVAAPAPTRAAAPAPAPAPAPAAAPEQRHGDEGDFDEDDLDDYDFQKNQVRGWKGRSRGGRGRGRGR